jgi:hypothetical protein
MYLLDCRVIRNYNKTPTAIGGCNSIQANSCASSTLLSYHTTISFFLIDLKLIQTVSHSSSNKEDCRNNGSYKKLIEY